MPRTGAPRPFPLSARGRCAWLLMCGVMVVLAACVDVGIPTRETPDDAGAAHSTQLLATWPANGSAGVPDELPHAYIALSSVGELAQIKTGWRGPTGPIPHRMDVLPCAEMGVDASLCVRCSPLARLPSGQHELGVDEGSFDSWGAPVPHDFVRFYVTSAAVSSALPSATSCERDEENIAGYCVLRGDTSLRVTAFLSATAIVELRAGETVVRSLAVRAEATLFVRGLAADTVYPVRMQAISLSGATNTADASVQTHAPLASLTITEVLADPLGPDPDQEYVEILNYGSYPLPLLGLTLADTPDRDGDEVRSGVVLPPGARALLVAARFDSSAMHGDAPVPEGVPLIRLEGPIATGGIGNSGEPLYLRDAQGRRLSTVPGIATGVPGRCVQRVAEDPRAGGSEAFVARATCTPGGAAAGETW